MTPKVASDKMWVCRWIRIERKQADAGRNKARAKPATDGRMFSLVAASAARVGRMIGRHDGSWKRLSALRVFLSGIRRLQKRPSQSWPLALAATTTSSSSHLCVFDTTPHLSYIY